MRIAMTHPAYKGGANVLPEHRATWEAAGWVAAPSPETSQDKETEE